MADFAMWGPEQSGFRLAEQDSIANFVKLSQGMHLQAQAAKDQQEVRHKAKIDAVMGSLSTPQGGGPANGGPLSDVPRSWGLQLGKAGFPIEGTAMLNHAAQMSERESQARLHDVQGKEAELKTKVELAHFVQGTIGSAVNQATYDQGLMALTERGVDVSELPKVYSKESVDMAARMSMQTKDRLHAQMEAIRAAAFAAEQKNKGVNRDARTEIYADRIESENEFRVGRLKVLGTDRKAGGGGKDKPITAPSNNEITQAGTAIKSILGPDVEIPSTDLFAMATEAAAMVKAELATNPGLKDVAAARVRAVTKLVKEQDLKATYSTFSSKATMHFSSGGRTPETALPAPSDPKELRTNHWYINNGKLGHWNGRGFIVPDTGKEVQPPPTGDMGSNSAKDRSWPK